jgi:hypothetical protein
MDRDPLLSIPLLSRPGEAGHTVMQRGRRGKRPVVVRFVTQRARVHILVWCAVDSVFVASLPHDLAAMSADGDSRRTCFSAI